MISPNVCSTGPRYGVSTVLPRNAPMTGQQMYGGSALAAAPAAPTAAPAARTTPAAPVDPADRKADTPYALPGGKLGMWRGNGWQVIQ